MITAASDHEERQDQYEASTHQILNAGLCLGLTNAVMAGVYQYGLHRNSLFHEMDMAPGSAIGFLSEV